MVQKVGALRSLHGMSIDKAVDAVEYAMVLVKGWPDKERSGIMSALEELKPIAEHNATVFSEAKAACQDFADQRDEIHHREEAAEKAQAAAVTLRERVEVDNAKAYAKLKFDQGAFDAEYRTQTAAMTARASELDARDATLKAAEVAAQKMTADAATLNGRAQQALSSAAATQADAAEIVKRLREIVKG